MPPANCFFTPYYVAVASNIFNLTQLAPRQDNKEKFLLSIWLTCFYKQFANNNTFSICLGASMRRNKAIALVR